MCGNGIRCFARYAVDTGLFHGDVMRVETAAGMKIIHFAGDDVQVNMGDPILEREEIPCTLPGTGPVIPESLPLGSSSLVVTCVSMGNPHAVQIVADVNSAPVLTEGAFLETHPMFPKRVNVGFMQVNNRHDVHVRVFERGAGETLACGTGICACLVAGIRRGELDSPVLVHARGGELTIAWRGKGESVLMTGPAITVFTGEIEL